MIFHRGMFMQMMSCPNCGQPISLLGHQCPFCHIQIVGASGLSKLMRQVGNSPVMLAGGLFLVAFLCAWSSCGRLESRKVDQPPGMPPDFPRSKSGKRVRFLVRKALTANKDRLPVRG